MGGGHGVCGGRKGGWRMGEGGDGGRVRGGRGSVRAWMACHRGGTCASARPSPLFSRYRCVEEFLGHAHRLQHSTRGREDQALHAPA